MIEKLADDLYFHKQRDRLISHLRENGISERTLEAMAQVPRHEFVSPLLYGLSYEDKPLGILTFNIKKSWSIWQKDTVLSTPLITAEMVDMLNVEKTDNVLEIGTATGYQAAILGKLASEVVTVDMLGDLCFQARRRLEKLNIHNVSVFIADGSIPFTESKAFDKIIVTASVPPYHHPPHPILELLKPGGLAVLPVGGMLGDPNMCQMLAIRSTDKGFSVEEQKDGYESVPLKGLKGWQFFPFNSYSRAIEELGGNSRLGLEGFFSPEVDELIFGVNQAYVSPTPKP